MKTYECDNCGCDLTVEEIIERGGRLYPNIPDLQERVLPGEPMPFAECPHCGCLMHEKQPGTTALQILKEFKQAQGCAAKFQDGVLKVTGQNKEDLWHAMLITELRDLNRNLTSAVSALQDVEGTLRRK